MLPWKLKISAPLTPHVTGSQPPTYRLRTGLAARVNLWVRVPDGSPDFSDTCAALPATFKSARTSRGRILEVSSFGWALDQFRGQENP